MGYLYAKNVNFWLKRSFFPGGSRYFIERRICWQIRRQNADFANSLSWNAPTFYIYILAFYGVIDLIRFP